MSYYWVKKKNEARRPEDTGFGQVGKNCIVGMICFAKSINVIIRKETRRRITC